MKNREVLDIGQMVFVGNKDKREIKGEITAIIIRKDYVKYEVTWWKEDSKKTEHVYEHELSVYGTKKKTKLGFGQ